MLKQAQMQFEAFRSLKHNLKNGFPQIVYRITIDIKTGYLYPVFN